MVTLLLFFRDKVPWDSVSDVRVLTVIRSRAWISACCEQTRWLCADLPPLRLSAGPAKQTARSNLRAQTSCSLNIDLDCFTLE